MTISTEDEGKVDSVREEEKKGKAEQERREQEVSLMQVHDMDVAASKVFAGIPDSVGGEGEGMDGQDGEVKNVDCENATNLTIEPIIAEDRPEDVSHNEFHEGGVKNTEKQDGVSALEALKNNTISEEKDAEVKDTKEHKFKSSLDEKADMQGKEEIVDIDVSLGQSEQKQEEKNLLKEKSRKGKDVVISDDSEKHQNVVSEKNGEEELVAKEKTGSNLQSNLPVKEEKSRRREKSMKPEKVDGAKKVENTGDGAQLEAKKTPKKDKKGKISSERMRRKLDKINAKIVRILAKKEDYVSRLQEALEREQLEKENAASQNLEAPAVKSTKDDTRTIKKGEDSGAQVSRSVHSPNCAVVNGPPPQQTKTATTEPYPPHFKEEMTQQELKIIQSITKR